MCCRSSWTISVLPRREAMCRGVCSSCNSKRVKRQRRDRADAPGSGPSGFVVSAWNVQDSHAKGTATALATAYFLFCYRGDLFGHDALLRLSQSMYLRELRHCFLSASKCFPTHYRFGPRLYLNINNPCFHTRQKSSPAVPRPTFSSKSFP